jgi:hypothetical protein
MSVAERDPVPIVAVVFGSIPAVFGPKAQVFVQPAGKAPGNGTTQRYVVRPNGPTVFLVPIARLRHRTYNRPTCGFGRVVARLPSMPGVAPVEQLS